MENFVVSARKYRPATFNTVVGQAHITNTLKNAMKNNHLAQAFLFCGPRGVGKTTCARILAKTINCTSRTENTEACDTCESCLSFNSGQSLNVYELDAASNNSVDDIRSLIEQVRYAPQLGAYKVYVIDEVHMLSQAAFNAFLKTLEEPPKHAIFILATTEKHKIIPTILSRCQIFDFNRIRIEDIASHLAFIAKSEGVDAEIDALHIIAQKADGALRDACSIFDQIVSFAGNTVTYKAVIENLNILDYDYYFKVVDFLLKEDVTNILLLFNEILQNGFDGHNFINGLAQHLRNLLVSKDEATVELLEVGSNIKEKYKEQQRACSLHFLINALNICTKSDYQYKSSKNQRLLVELALLQIATANSLLAQQAEKKNDISEQKQASTPVSNTPQSPMPSIVPRVEEKKESTYDTQTLMSTTQPVLTGKLGLGSKTFSKSINSILNPEKKEEAAQTPSALIAEIKNEFTQEQLNTAWKDFAETIKDIKPSLYSTLSASLPVLQVNFLIEFSVVSQMQADDVFAIKEKMIEYLRNQLNNNIFRIETKVDNTIQEVKAYTNADKVKKMLEINPNVKKLIQDFDLDIGY
ncbi:MAG: DNA polymerase III subunit gamma/tau [Bacteroidota bacterium]